MSSTRFLPCNISGWSTNKMKYDFYIFFFSLSFYWLTCLPPHGNGKAHKNLYSLFHLDRLSGSLYVKCQPNNRKLGNLFYNSSKDFFVGIVHEWRLTSDEKNHFLEWSVVGFSSILQLLSLDKRISRIPLCLCVPLPLGYTPSVNGG